MRTAHTLDLVPVLDRIPGRLVLVSKSINDERKARGAAGQPLLVQHAGRRFECLVVGEVEFAADSPLAPLLTAAEG